MASTAAPAPARMAQRYIWWKPPEESFKHLHLLFAQMMTLGMMEDLRWLMSVTTDDDFRKVLRIAPAGIFNGRAWHFWHHRLGMTPVPELPKRYIPKSWAEVQASLEAQVLKK